MKLSGSTVAFRRSKLRDALGWLRKSGFDEVELCCLFGSFCPHFDPTGSQAFSVLEDLCADMSVSALYVGMAPWNAVDRSVRAAQQLLVAGAVRVAKAAGISTVAVQSGAKPSSAEHRDDTVHLAAEGIRAAARLAEQLGVDLSLDIQSSSLIEDVVEAEHMLSLINSPAVGVTVDVSYLTSLGLDPAEAIRRLGTRVRHVRLRVEPSGQSSLTPDGNPVDLSTVFAALRDANYVRACALSIDESKVKDPEEISASLRRTLSHLERDFRCSSRCEPDQVESSPDSSIRRDRLFDKATATSLADCH